MTLFARSGVGIEFEASDSTRCVQEGGTQAANAVSAIFVEENFKITHSYPYLEDRSGCFKTAAEQLNHVEIHISQTSIEVFVSDAGDRASFRSLLRIDAASDNLSLPLTRGYVNLQHTHYNGAKCAETTLALNPGFTQAQVDQVCGKVTSFHSYHWDNVAFDGPVFATPRSYETPDALKPSADGTEVHLGYILPGDGTNVLGPFTLHGVDATGAVDAVLTASTWNFAYGANGTSDSIKFRFNGGAWQTFNYPFPQEQFDSARPVAMPVDLASLKPGDNTLELQVDRTSPAHVGNGEGTVIGNIELTIDVN
jgi:hypothetical protein